MAGLLAVGAVASSPAAATPGQIYGPYAGKFYGSFGPKVGANGTVVVYATWLKNFDSGAPLFDLGVYYRDRGAGSTGTVVQPASGPRPNGTSWPLGVSPDTSSSYILYRSTASNLVSGDTAGQSDIFLFNRFTQTTERISVSDTEAEGNGGAVNAAMSGNTSTGDPRYVAFSSAASNLVAGDSNGKADIFVRDRVAGTTRRVSLGSGATQANGDSFGMSISDDGRYVAFSSAASNLVAGDTNATTDVFVRDTIGNRTNLVSNGHAGPVSGASAVPNISADGRFVAFDSDGDDVVPGDENFATDVFVRDQFFGTIERVSVGPNGEEGFGDSANPSMSRDGRFIAFESDAEEFSANDGNISVDIYVRNRPAKVTQRATEKPSGFDAFGDAFDATISPEGRYVGFFSDSEEFACSGCDSNDDDDVYLKDLGAAFVNDTNLGGRFWPVAPKRLLDTSAGPVPSGWTVGTKLAGGGTVDVQVSGGATTIPATATAVVLNVMSSGETAAGAELTAYPTGTTRPTAVALHPQVGASVSNQIVAKIGSGGRVRLFTNTGATHVRVDVVGWYAPDLGDGFTSVTADPVVDTRTGAVPAGWPAGQKLAAGGGFARLDMQVAGAANSEDVVDVPANARAVALTITAMDPTVANATVTAFRTGSANPGTANVLPQLGQLVTNTAVVPIGAGGRVSLAINSGAAHVAVSVAGYYGPFSDELFFGLNPARVLDTRSTSPVLSIPGGGGAVQSIQSADVPLAGRGGIPANARDVALTMSSAAVAAPGVLIVWPTDSPMVLRSNLTYRTGVNASNTVLTGLGTDGSISMFNYALTPTHVFADVYGYFR